MRPRLSQAVIHQWTRRALATEATAAESNAGPSQPTRSATSSEYHGRQSSRRATKLFVRPWDRISSMPELFAVIRGIERKYGRIQEYNIMREYDLPNQYIPYFFVRFADSDTLTRVPRQPSVLKVEVPVYDETRPGGVGLDELQSVLLSRERDDDTLGELVPWQDASAEGQKQVATKTVDLRLELSTLPFAMAGLDVGQRSTNFKFLNGFQTWGGFHTPAPDEPESTTQFMRQLQRKWEKRQDDQRTKQRARVDSTEPGKEAAEPSSEVPEAQSVPVETTNSAVDAASIERLMASVGVSGARRAAAAGTGAPAATPSSPDASQASMTIGTLESSSSPRRTIMSRRERILEQARHNARTPLPASVKATTEEKKQERKQELEREKEEEQQVRISMRERLWELMGGKWF